MNEELQKFVNPKLDTIKQAQDAVNTDIPDWNTESIGIEFLTPDQQSSLESMSDQLESIVEVLNTVEATIDALMKPIIAILGALEDPLGALLKQVAAELDKIANAMDNQGIFVLNKITEVRTHNTANFLTFLDESVGIETKSLREFRARRRAATTGVSWTGIDSKTDYTKVKKERINPAPITYKEELELLKKDSVIKSAIIWIKEYHDEVEQLVKVASNLYHSNELAINGMLQAKKFPAAQIKNIRKVYIDTGMIESPFDKSEKTKTAVFNIPSFTELVGEKEDNGDYLSDGIELIKERMAGADFFNLLTKEKSKTDKQKEDTKDGKNPPTRGQKNFKDPGSSVNHADTLLKIEPIKKLSRIPDVDVKTEDWNNKEDPEEQKKYKKNRDEMIDNAGRFIKEYEELEKKSGGNILELKLKTYVLIEKYFRKPYEPTKFIHNYKAPIVPTATVEKVTQQVATALKKSDYTSGIEGDIVTKVTNLKRDNILPYPGGFRKNREVLDLLHVNVVKTQENEIRFFHKMSDLIQKNIAHKGNVRVSSSAISSNEGKRPQSLASVTVEDPNQAAVISQSAGLTQINSEAMGVMNAIIASIAEDVKNANLKKSKLLAVSKEYKMLLANMLGTLSVGLVSLDQSIIDARNFANTLVAEPYTEGAIRYYIGADGQMQKYFNYIIRDITKIEMAFQPLIIKNSLVRKSGIRGNSNNNFTHEEWWTKSSNDDVFKAEIFILRMLMDYKTSIFAVVQTYLNQLVSVFNREGDTSVLNPIEPFELYGLGYKANDKLYGKNSLEGINSENNAKRRAIFVTYMSNINTVLAEEIGTPANLLKSAKGLGLTKIVTSHIRFISALTKQGVGKIEELKNKLGAKVAENKLSPGCGITPTIPTEVKKQISKQIRENEELLVKYKEFLIRKRKDFSDEYNKNVKPWVTVSSSLTSTVSPYRIEESVADINALVKEIGGFYYKSDLKNSTIERTTKSHVGTINEKIVKQTDLILELKGKATGVDKEVKAILGDHDTKSKILLAISEAEQRVAEGVDDDAQADLDTLNGTFEVLAGSADSTQSTVVGKHITLMLEINKAIRALRRIEIDFDQVDLKIPDDASVTKSDIKSFMFDGKISSNIDVEKMLKTHHEEAEKQEKEAKEGKDEKTEEWFNDTYKEKIFEPHVSSCYLTSNGGNTVLASEKPGIISSTSSSDVINKFNDLLINLSGWGFENETQADKDKMSSLLTYMNPPGVLDALNAGTIPSIENYATSILATLLAKVNFVTEADYAMFSKAVQPTSNAIITRWGYPTKDTPGFLLPFNLRIEQLKKMRLEVRKWVKQGEDASSKNRNTAGAGHPRRKAYKVSSKNQFIYEVIASLRDEGDVLRPIFPDDVSTAKPAAALFGEKAQESLAKIEALGDLTMYVMIVAGSDIGVVWPELKKITEIFDDPGGTVKKKVNKIEDKIRKAISNMAKVGKQNFTKAAWKSAWGGPSPSKARFANYFKSYVNAVACSSGDRPIVAEPLRPHESNLWSSVRLTDFIVFNVPVAALRRLAAYIRNMAVPSIGLADLLQDILDFLKNRISALKNLVAAIGLFIELIDFLLGFHINASTLEIENVRDINQVDDTLRNAKNWPSNAFMQSPDDAAVIGGIIFVMPSTLYKNTFKKMFKPQTGMTYDIPTDAVEVYEEPKDLEEALIRAGIDGAEEAVKAFVKDDALAALIMDELEKKMGEGNSYQDAAGEIDLNNFTSNTLIV